MVNLRVATFLYPPYIDKDENGQPTGVKLVLKRIRHARSLAAKQGVNLTFVYNEDATLGKFENGTYDGLLGLIYNDEADVAMVPCPLETDPPPGNFGPVIYSADVRIYTLVNPPTWQTVDFLSCLNVFDTAINSLIFLALISIGCLLVKHYKRQTLLVLLSNALKQSFSTVEALGFLPHLSMLMGILLVQALHSALYSTNSWIEVGPKKVDTLQDVVTQQKEPVFHKGTPVRIMFKNGFSKDAKKVWKKAEEVGLSKCLVHNDRLLPMANNVSLGSKKAFIFLTYFESLAPVIVCQSNGKLFEDGFRVHVSKSVHSGLMATLRNPRLSYPDYQVVDKIYYDIFELGYVQNFMENLKNDPPIDAGPASARCRREICQDKLLNEEVSEIKLTLVDVGHALILFLAILIVLSAHFLIEFLRRY